MDSTTEKALWALTDYGLLAKETQEKSPGRGSFLSNLPSPSSWSYPMDEFATAPDLCNPSAENAMLFLGVDGSTGY